MNASEQAKPNPVLAFSKLPQQFGFSIEYTDNNANLRYYDRAAQMWCENATTLTGEQWRYVKVPQKEYMKLQPVEFYDLLAFVS